MPARFINELDTEEIITRLIAYSQLQGQCVRELHRRGIPYTEFTSQEVDAYMAGVDPSGSDETEFTAAADWLKFIVRESLNPLHDDPARELARLKRYALTASLCCTESGGPPDD